MSVDKETMDNLLSHEPTEADRECARAVLMGVVSSFTLRPKDIDLGGAFIATHVRQATDSLRAQVEALKAELAEEERQHGTTIDQRDRAEEAANALTAEILGEEINWSDHDAKWHEAIDDAYDSNYVRKLDADLKSAQAQARLLREALDMSAILRKCLQHIHEAATDQAADIMTEPTWNPDYSLPFTLTVRQLRQIHAFLMTKERPKKLPRLQPIPPTRTHRSEVKP